MKNVKRYNPNTFNALHAAIAYLGYWAMNLLVGVIYILLGKAVGADLYAGEFILDEFGDSCISMALIAGGLAALTGIMCLAARTKPISGGGFLARKGCGMEILMTFVLVFGFCAVLLPVADSFVSNWEYIRLFGLGLGGSGGGETGASGWAFLAMLLIPVLPAIFEELLFRGVILRGLLQFGKIPAVILSALMFALAHGSYQQFIYQFLLGLVIGFLYVEIKNIFVCMAAHFANNFFSSWVLGIAYAFTGEGELQLVYQAVVEIMFCLIGAVCVIAGIIYFAKRMIHMSKFPDRSKSEVTATFTERDPIAGTQYVERPWYDCGRLIARDAEGENYITASNGEAHMNRKAGSVLSAVLTGVGILIGIIFFAVSVLN